MLSHSIISKSVLSALYSVSKCLIVIYTLNVVSKLELYLFDRALQLEPGKSPSTVKGAVQNMSATGSKIVEKRCLATSKQQLPSLFTVSFSGKTLSAKGN